MLSTSAGGTSLGVPYPHRGYVVLVLGTAACTLYSNTLRIHATWYYS